MIAVRVAIERRVRHAKRANTRNEARCECQGGYPNVSTTAPAFSASEQPRWAVACFVSRKPACPREQQLLGGVIPAFHMREFPGPVPSVQPTGAGCALCGPPPKPVGGAGDPQVTDPTGNARALSGCMNRVLSRNAFGRPFIPLDEVNAELHFFGPTFALRALQGLLTRRGDYVGCSCNAYDARRQYQNHDVC